MFFDDFKRWRRWDPLRDVRRLQQQLNEVLEGGLPFPGFGGTPYPPLNAWSNEEKLVVHVEMPGVSADDIEVSVLSQTLTIKGTRPAEELSERDVFHRQERGHGTFVRTVELPFAVEADAVEAKYRQGILTLELPRAEADRPRRISVKSE